MDTSSPETQATPHFPPRDAHSSTAPMPPPPPPRRRSGCVWGVGLTCGCLFSCILLFGAFIGLFAWLGVSLVDTMHVTTTQVSTSYAFDHGHEGEDGVGVLRLELNGVITGISTNRWYQSPNSDVALREQIEKVIDDDTIKALLLVVNSPGGDVTASDNLYHALERFKAAKEGRKVIVQGGNLVASGAYYMAMQADWIRVVPTSLVGSIGVIMPGVNVSGLAGRLGVTDNSITSGKAKDLNNLLKPVNPEHNAILQTIVDGMYRRFVLLVVQGRHLTEEQVLRLADGRVYLPDEALALGLIDEIGYEDTLPAKIAEVLGCAEDDLTFYKVSTNASDKFLQILSEFPSALGRGVSEAITSEALLQPTATPGNAQYLWQGNR